MRHLIPTLILILAVPLARADVVRLKNGNTLEGKVVEENDREIRIKTGDGGTMLMMRDQIASIERSESPLDVYTGRAAGLAEDDADGHLKLADYCLEHRLTSQAIAELRRVRAIQPDSKDALAKLRPLLDQRAASLFSRGKALQDEGQFEDAEKPLIEVLDSFPESSYAALAQHHLAAGYAARHQYDLALTRWRRALDLDPTLAEACEGAAHAATELGDWALARDYTQRALQLAKEPALATTLQDRAAALGQLADLAKAPKVEQAKPAHLAQMGHLLLRLGLTDRAIASLEAAYDAGSRDVDLLRLLADHYERKGRVQHALDLCDELFRLQPQSEDLVRRRVRLQRLLAIPKALSTRDKRERERLLYEIVKSGASFAYVEAALRESTVRPPQKEGLAEGTFVIDELLTTAAYTSYVPKGYDPRRPWPLLIALHRDGDSGKDHFFNVETIATEGRYLVMLPTAPRKSKSWRFTDINVILSALREARKLYNVDTGRIVLSGTGGGGILAWAVALRHPDLFAALIVRNARIDEVSLLYLPAAINLPVYQVAAEMSPPELIGSVRAADAALARMGYIARREEVPGYQRHPSLPELNPKLTEWLRDKVRDPYAPRLRLVTFEPSNAMAYWLRIDRFADSVFDPDRRIAIKAPLGMEYTPEQMQSIYLSEMARSMGFVAAAIASDNRINIDARHIAELTIFLDDAMVDLDKPVRVFVNGKQAFQGKVERTLTHLFDSARLTGDPRMCYAASVKVQVR